MKQSDLTNRIFGRLDVLGLSEISRNREEKQRIEAMSKEIYIEFFLNKDDADYWLDNHLREHSDGWSILEASVRYVNGGWSAGVIFTKNQMELELDNG